MKVTIGTRGSDLALWQAHHVEGLLQAAGCSTEIVVLKTRGDRIDDVPLTGLEGNGFFTQEIEAALRDGRVDLAVHSHKDLPVEDPPALVIAAVPPRAAAIELLLLSPSAHEPSNSFLPVRTGARIGTSSPRRAQQLASLRPDLDVRDLRGNVPTRVRRLREGRYDAILIAAAGVDRLELDLSDLVPVRLPPELIVPAPAQGALALQARASDEDLLSLCRERLHDSVTAEAIHAERSLLAFAGGGCSLPLGAHVAEHGAGWRATAFLGADHPEPGRAARWCFADGEDPASAAQAVHGKLMAEASTKQGPLQGVRIAYAGSIDSGFDLRARLSVLGAEVIVEPVLEFEDLDAPRLAEALAGLREGDGLAVTSRRAAQRLAGIELPRGVLVGAVGPATEKALQTAGIPVDCVSSGGARSLGKTLPVQRGARVLFPSAEAALPDLEQELGARDIEVERLPVYRTRARRDATLAGKVDVRLFTSPSALEACLALGGLDELRQARSLALGETTARACAQHGLNAAAPERDHTDGIVQLLVSHAPRLENVR